MIENMLDIEKYEVKENLQMMIEEGYRFITMSCVELEDGFNIIYHFDKDYELQNYRIKIGRDEELESVSKMFFCALLVENEIKDLFGVKIQDILIDYNGHLLLSEGAPYAPMRSKNQIEIEVRGQENGE